MDPSFELFGKTITLHITDLNIGVLYVLSISSIGILGIILGGWASNSKYPLMGALRSAAQMVSYEVALGFSIMGVLMITGSLSLVEIVEQAEGVRLVVRLPAAAGIHSVLCLRHCGNQPRAVRSA